MSKKQITKPCLNLTSDQRQKLKGVQLEIFDHFLDFCQKHNLQYQLGWGTLLGAVRHKGFIPWDDDLDVCMPAKDYYRFINEYQDENGFHLDCREKDSRCWQSFAKLMKDGTVYEEYVKQRCDMAKGIFIDIFPIVSFPSPSRKFKFLARKAYLYMLNVKCLPKQFLPVPGTKPNHPIIGKMARFLSRLAFFWCSREKATAIRNKSMRKHAFENTGWVNASDVIFQIAPAELFEGESTVEFEGRKVKAPANPDAMLKYLYGNYMEYPPEEERIPHHYVSEISFGED